MRCYPAAGSSTRKRFRHSASAVRGTPDRHITLQTVEDAKRYKRDASPTLPVPYRFVDTQAAHCPESAGAFVVSMKRKENHVSCLHLSDGGHRRRRDLNRRSDRTCREKI
jgi:hypothetical protein